SIVDSRSLASPRLSRGAPARRSRRLGLLGPSLQRELLQCRPRSSIRVCSHPHACRAGPLLAAHAASASLARHCSVNCFSVGLDRRFAFARIPTLVARGPCSPLTPPRPPWPVTAA